jgi:hypothetical protein
MIEKRPRKSTTRKPASRKKATLSKKKAYRAAKAAKRAYAKKAAKRPAGWKKGGREWSRVLGHFGISFPDSHKS